MNELTLVASEIFEDVPYNIYSQGGSPCMTSEQLGECLGYSHPRESINKLVSRNDYLRGPEFSAEVKMTSPRGDTQITRVFTEDGIYEVTMLAKTDRAKEFRATIRRVLKSLRKGETKLVSMTEYQKRTIAARERSMQIQEDANRIKKAQFWERLAKKYSGTTYEQILDAHATLEIAGQYVIQPPTTPEKTYSAEEIGDMVGVSGNKVGRIANANNLKVEQYGVWALDKSPYSNKEVNSFRYYASVVPVIQRILGEEAV